MIDLNSRQNPKIKLARSLSQRKARQESGRFLVEGLRHLGELADSSFKTDYILYAPDSITSGFGHALMDRFRTKNLPVLSTTTDILNGLSSKKSSLGALAVVHQTNLIPNNVVPEPNRPTVALLSPQDPGNIGTILRTMDAVQAGPLFLLNGGADPWQSSSVRASMGAIFWHPIVQSSFEAFTAWAQQYSVHIFGTSAKGTEAHTLLNGYAQPGALLLGSERAGLSPSQTEFCEHLIRLPMEGRGSSLNLAVAAGIMLYEMRARS